MKKIISITVTIALAGFLIYAITFQKKEIPVEKPGNVVTTTAYAKFFGAAPPVDKGTAYAFVIYFPSSKEPGKVVPFPFFTFDEASLKKVAVARLLDGMDIGSYQGEFLQPFPAGTKVTTSENQGAVTVTLSREFGRAVQDKSAEHAARAIALTLRQFKGVATVRIRVEGNNAPLDVRADEQAILPPGPPRLLSLTAMKDKGAKGVEDVNAFFDRPVDVKELRMSAQDGSVFDGDIYHSVFDMAAVLKPKNPAQFKERLPIKVRWKVVDKLGRQAEGDNVWFLEVKQHEQ